MTISPISRSFGRRTPGPMVPLAALMLLVALAAGCSKKSETTAEATDPSGTPNAAAPAHPTPSGDGAAPAGQPPAMGSTAQGGLPPAGDPGSPGMPPAPSAPAVPLTPSGPPDQVVAKVNGTTITRGELDFAVKSVTSNNPQPVAAEQHTEVRKSVLDELVDQELLYQKALASKYNASSAEMADQIAKVKASFPDEKTYVTQLAEAGLKPAQLEHLLQHRIVIQKYVQSNIFDKITISADDEAKFYAENKERMKHPEQLRASHILRLVKQGATPQEKEAQKAKANEALARAKKGEDFAALAREFSEDGSKAQGGDLGFFAKGKMVPAFDAAAWVLKPGEISDLVESPFGFHVIKVTDKRGEGYVPMADVKMQIDNKLKNDRAEAELEKLRGSLRSGAKVVITL